MDCLCQLLGLNGDIWKLEAQFKDLIARHVTGFDCKPNNHVGYESIRAKWGTIFGLLGYPLDFSAKIDVTARKPLKLLGYSCDIFFGFASSRMAFSDCSLPQATQTSLSLVIAFCAVSLFAVPNGQSLFFNSTPLL
jgi:hypothetical protein